MHIHKKVSSCSECFLLLIKKKTKKQSLEFIQTSFVYTKPFYLQQYLFFLRHFLFLQCSLFLKTVGLKKTYEYLCYHAKTGDCFFVCILCHFQQPFSHTLAMMMSGCSRELSTHFYLVVSLKNDMMFHSVTLY